MYNIMLCYSVTKNLNKVTSVKNDGEHGRDTGVEEKVNSSRGIAEGCEDKDKVFFF